MILILGLGNPGKKYQKNRHNVGFQIVDKIQKFFKFPDFYSQDFLESQISQGKISQKKIILAKPKTFMNESGRATKKLVENFKIPLKNLWVIHDEIDLPLGKIKIVKNRGSAGHKGVESIIFNLKTKDFVRFRIGIQPKSGKPKNLEKFVLKDFTEKEKKLLDKAVEKTIKAIEIATKEGIEKAMSKVN